MHITKDGRLLTEQECKDWFAAERAATLREAAAIVTASAHDKRCASLGDQSHINPQLCDCANRLTADAILARIEPGAQSALDRKLTEARLEAKMQSCLECGCCECLGVLPQYRKDLAALRGELKEA